MSNIEPKGGFLFINKDCDSLKITPAESFEIASHLSKAQWREERKRKLEVLGPHFSLRASDTSTIPGRNRYRQITRVRRQAPAGTTKATKHKTSRDEVVEDSRLLVNNNSRDKSLSITCQGPGRTRVEGAANRTSSWAASSSAYTERNETATHIEYCSPSRAATILPLRTSNMLRVCDPDPFETFPVRSRPYTQTIIRFWMEEIVPKAIMANFSCLHLIWSSTVLFESYLAYGLQMMAIRRPCAHNNVLNHKTACLSLLSQHMEQQPLDDATIIAICTIISLDVAAQNMEYCPVHINGLREVVRMRGGLDVLSNTARNCVIASEVLLCLYEASTMAKTSETIRCRKTFSMMFEHRLEGIGRIYGVQAPGAIMEVDDVLPPPHQTGMSSSMAWSEFVDVCFWVTIALGAVEGSYQHLARFSGEARKKSRQS